MSDLERVQDPPHRNLRLITRRCMKRLVASHGVRQYDRLPSLIPEMQRRVSWQ